MVESIGDLIALILGLVALWFLIGVLSRDLRSADRRRSPRGIKGGI